MAEIFLSVNHTLDVLVTLNLTNVTCPLVICLVHFLHYWLCCCESGISYVCPCCLLVQLLDQCVCVCVRGSGSGWSWAVEGNGIVSVWQRGGVVMKWGARAVRARHFNWQPPTPEDPHHLACCLCIFFHTCGNVCIWLHMFMPIQTQCFRRVTVHADGQTGSQELMFANCP